MCRRLYAAEMTPFDPLVGEFRVHYAGFFDPGFGHCRSRRQRQPGVLEVRSHEVPFILEHGQIVGRLVYEQHAEAPEGALRPRPRFELPGPGAQALQAFPLPVQHCELSRRPERARGWSGSPFLGAAGPALPPGPCRWSRRRRRTDPGRRLPIPRRRIRAAYAAVPAPPRSAGRPA